MRRRTQARRVPRTPRPLPESLGDAFSTSDARAAGASHGRLRAKDLERPFHGARLRLPIEGPDDEDEDPRTSRWELDRRAEKRRARALSTVMTPGTFFAARTAAVLQCAAIDPGPELVVGVFAPTRAPRHAGVRSVQVPLDSAFLRMHDGLRMTSPASTWAMLARELTVRELVIVGDSFVRIPRNAKGRLQPDRQVATIEQLERATGSCRRIGVAKLREALPLIRVGSASPLETDFRLDAMAGGLPEPELDVEIRDAGGALLGISEVVYRPQRLAVEIEGDHHRTSRAQWNRDIDKYTSYAAAGWEVIRLTSTHIRGDRARAVALVRAALRRRGGVE